MRASVVTAGTRGSRSSTVCRWRPIRSWTTSIRSSGRRSLSDGAPLCIVAPRRAPARPGCSPAASPAASGTGRPIPATCWSSPSPGRPRASWPAGCGALGPRDAVAAGTFHGLAYRLLRQRWEDQRRRAPALAVVPTPARRGGAGRPRAGAPRRGAAQEVAAEIDWARARQVGPPAYAARGRGGRAAHAARPGRGGRALRALRGAEAGPAGGRLRRPAALVVAEMARDSAYARRRALALPPPVRRRVPGREPAAAGRSWRPGAAAGPTCAWSATRSRPSTGGTAPTAAGSRTSPPTTRARPSCTCAAATARPPRSSASATPC